MKLPFTLAWFEKREAIELAKREERFKWQTRYRVLFGLLSFAGSEIRTSAESRVNEARRLCQLWGLPPTDTKEI